MQAGLQTSLAWRCQPAPSGNRGAEVKQTGPPGREPSIVICPYPSTAGSCMRVHRLRQDL